MPKPRVPMNMITAVRKNTRTEVQLACKQRKLTCITRAVTALIMQQSKDNSLISAVIASGIEFQIVATVPLCSSADAPNISVDIENGNMIVYKLPNPRVYQ